MTIRRRFTYSFLGILTLFAFNVIEVGTRSIPSTVGGRVGLISRPRASCAPVADAMVIVRASATDVARRTK